MCSGVCPGWVARGVRCAVLRPQKALWEQGSEPARCERGPERDLNAVGLNSPDAARTRAARSPRRRRRGMVVPTAPRAPGRFRRSAIWATERTRPVVGSTGHDCPAAGTAERTRPLAAASCRPVPAALLPVAQNSGPADRRGQRRAAESVPALLPPLRACARCLQSSFRAQQENNRLTTIGKYMP